MPTWNRAHLLPHSVDSLLAQTYQDWELVIADDGSTDATPQVTAEYAAKDERIRVLHNPTYLGIVPNWHIGFAAARGRYFAVLHDDDLWEPGFLSATTAVLDGHPEAAFVSTDHSVIDAAGALMPGQADTMSEQFGRRALREGVVEDTLGRAMEEQSFPIGASLFRREALEAVGWLREESRAIYDYDLFMRLGLAGCKAYYLPQRLMRYRIHGGQLTTVGGIQKSLGMISVLEQQHFDEPRIEDVRTRRLQQAVYNAGRGYLEAGDGAAARPYLLRSIVHPRHSLRAAVGLGLSLLPKRASGRLIAAYRGR